MSQERSKHIRTLSAAFVIVLVMLFSKLGLTVVHFILPKEQGQLSIFASEVMAEDRKGKAAEKAPQKKHSAQEQAPTQTPSTPTQGSATRPSLTSVPDMISYLEQRDADLNKREDALRQKEEYLSQMEQEVEKKLKQLTAIQKEIQVQRTEKEEGQNAKVRSLAKIYGTMKPKEAAKLLENLEEPLAVEIIATMTPIEAANILSNMDVKKAAKTSQSLSHR